MKKMMAGLMPAALVLALATTSALAAPRHARAIERVGCGSQQAGQMCRWACYVDADNNGVCDNYDPASCPGSGQGNGSAGGGQGHHGGGHHR